MNEDQCSICHENDSDDMHILECEHKFHTACIVSWFRRGHKDCPLCRDSPEFGEQGHLCRPRYKFMLNFSKRKNAPLELKKLVQKLRARKQKIKQLKKEFSFFNLEHVQILKTWKTKNRKIYAAKLAVRELEKVVGCFSCSGFQLPPLRVYSMDFN